MSQTLIITGKESFADMLNLNLSTYVGTDVIIKKTFADSQVLIENHPGIHLIITDEEISKEKTARELIIFLDDQARSIPVIIIGAKEKFTELNLVEVVSPDLEIRSLLQVAAKFLKITPVDMANRAVPDYYPIGTNYCLSMKNAPCDIFIHDHNGAYIKRFENGSDFSPGEISDLIDFGGHSTIYVDSANRLKFVNEATISLNTQLSNSNIPIEEKVSTANASMHVVQEEVIRGGNAKIEKAVEELTSTAISTCMEIAKNDTRVANLLKKLLANKSSYLYQHIQLNIYICQAVLKHVEWGSSEQADKLAFVAFFHDICLTKDSMAKVSTQAELDKSDDLSMYERELIHKHAKMSSDIVQKFPIAPLGADAIILQHHGVVSGLGFTETYTNNISPLAILFIVAEELTNLILEQPIEMDLKSNKRKYLKVLRKKFDRSKYVKIIDIIDKHLSF